ncbi:MAG: tol-pal system protein YbgF [Deltaproteobacteria bacterium]|nr:tol-pal system protein YbgF [Deltaproteobacteria bacterium]
MHRPLMSLLISLLILAGCVTTEQDLQTQRELMELKRRLAEAERSLKVLQDDQTGGVRARVETLAQNQADAQAGLDSLRVDMQSIQGRFDDQARGADELRQEITLLRDELGLQIADLEQRLNLLSGREAVPQQSSVPEPVSSPPTPVAAPSSATLSTAPSPTPKQETAVALYERALVMIREVKDFSGGRELMETFLKRYPQDPLAVNAAYWVGETYYAEKNYEQAILKFEDVIQNFSDHPKVASALLKQGLAFDALGDRTNAKLLLQRVVKNFPLAEEARLAEEKLKEWGS